MILADTSVWIDHLRAGDPVLARLLEDCQVVTHDFVIGELALGSMKNRSAVLDMLQNLRHAESAYDEEVLVFIDRHRLHGRGIGYIDSHLLASVRLTADTRLWTRDKRLRTVAQSLSLAAELT